MVESRSAALKQGKVVDVGRSRDTEHTLLSDPQTSGRLLVACMRAVVHEVLRVLRDEGSERAAVIGEMTCGEPGVQAR